MSNPDFETRILDGAVWDDFCDRLKGLGELVREPGTPTDVVNRAQGYRFLTRILRAGLESAVEQVIKMLDVGQRSRGAIAVIEPSKETKACLVYT